MVDSQTILVCLWEHWDSLDSSRPHIHPLPRGRRSALLAVGVWCWSGPPSSIRAPRCRRNGLNVTLSPASVYAVWASHVAPHAAVRGAKKLFLEFRMRSQMETAELKWFLLYLKTLRDSTSLCTRRCLPLITGDGSNWNSYCPSKRTFNYLWKGARINTAAGQASRHTHTCTGVFRLQVRGALTGTE